ncbi:hypothetical protein ACFT7S_21680 [Streptomyces sp. NPDC057136]|uniref:hypothetical protein n=1 Tax=Streptomyces sp. NPDC057136 TaxID=3346029 RepID=UPI003632BAF5
MTDARSPMRTLRAALFAAVCVVLAAVGHSYMSGHDIPAGALLAAFATTGAIGWLGGGRRRGAVAIGGGLIAVQTALHMIFAGTQPQTMPSRPSMPHSGVGGMEAEMSMAGSGGHGDGGMLAAHLLAAVVCALWLARGEAAFFALARTVDALAFTPLRLLLTAVRLPDAPQLPSGARTRARNSLSHGVVLAHSLSRRGPPVFSPTRATTPGAAI